MLYSLTTCFSIPYIILIEEWEFVAKVSSVIVLMRNDLSDLGYTEYVSYQTKLHLS